MGNAPSTAAPSDGSTSRSSTQTVPLPLTPFTISEVTLTAGTDLHSRAVSNAEYLVSLSVDRLLYSFRQWAGVDLRGAKPYGGWESPTSGGRGSFTGHALGAYAAASVSMKASRPDLAAACLTATTSMVAGMAEVQTAIGPLIAPQPFGYLNAQSPAALDELEKLQQCFVPLYVLHKIMAGLVAAHHYTANAQALTVVSAMADYLAWRFSRLTEERIQAMIDTRRYAGQVNRFFMEHGGMLDVLVDVYRLTQKAEHLTLLTHFDRPWFRQMLSANDDQLGQNGEHSNTELPVVVGLANLYTLTGKAVYQQSVLNFLQWMQTGHEFCTGGVSGKSAYPSPLDYNSELFNTPQLLDRQINSTAGHQGQSSGESCCAHNLQKSTMYGLQWTGDARWGDEWEKRFVNCVMPQQNAQTGMLLYNLNLKQGAQKGFGDKENSFWCCYGTGVEAFAGLANGHFYHDSSNGLWVNGYAASTISWAAQGLSLEVQSTWPMAGNVQLKVTVAAPTRLVLHLRIPYWATGSVALLLNGQPLSGVSTTAGTFASIDRQWSSGDVVELQLPFSLYSEPIPDRAEMVAVKFGPLVLVALAPQGAYFQGTAKQLLAALKPVTGQPCSFTAILQGPLRPQSVVFQPLHSVVDESYNGYTRVSQPPAMVIQDFVSIADAASESAHSFKSLNSTTGSASSLPWRDARDNGFIEYKLQVHSSEQTFLRVMYDGDDAGNADFWRLFDVQALKADASYYSFATQSLDNEAPGEWYTVVYPIPVALTKEQSSLTIRLQAKGYSSKPGFLGGVFDQIQTFVLSEAEEVEEELWTLVRA